MRATYVVFNGKAFQYKDAPLQVDEGDVVRLFVMNAGPNIRSDFHVVGNIFDRVYPDGNPRNAMESVQTWQVPAGGGAVFETVFEEGKSGEGQYAFVRDLAEWGVTSGHLSGIRLWAPDYCTGGWQPMSCFSVPADGVATAKPVIDAVDDGVDLARRQRHDN